jgi:DNA polymerase-3 subunit delta'
VTTTNHKKQREFLENKLKSNQLAHAYLFSGLKDIGKKDFAVEFAEFLECKFPDLIIVEAEDGEISIKKIREVQNFLSYKSYNAGFKIVVVEDAEKMNQEAQSCFLKTLEEPKGKTLLILISSKPDMLLPTIISRCQQIKFFKPKDLPKNLEKLEKEKNILNDLLSVIGLNFSEKFKYVKSIDFEKKNASDILEVMQRYIRHLLMVKIGVDKPDNKDINFQKYSVDDLKRILNLVEDIGKKLFFTNASPKLALEILLMEL